MENLQVQQRLRAMPPSGCFRSVTSTTKLSTWRAPFTAGHLQPYGRTDDKVELNRIGYYWFLRALQRHLAKRRCRAPVNERLLLARVLYSQKFWLTHNRNLLCATPRLRQSRQGLPSFVAFPERYSLGQGRSVCLVECASRSDRHVALFTRRQLNDREDIL